MCPFVSCVNNRDLLERNLCRSPDVVALGLRIYENSRSAASAYNDALAKAEPGSAYTIFVHQDIYLPEGWLAKLRWDIARLTVHDPSWGVLGCYGVTSTGQGEGHVYSNGLGVLGRSFERPIRVRTLDEIVLVVQHVPSLRFTDGHPGFHLYGTDICLRAEQLSLSCYVVNDLCVHNARSDSALPLAFYQSYLAVMRNFPKALPVKTPCATITNSVWPMRMTLLRQRLARLAGRARIVERLADPAGVL